MESSTSSVSRLRISFVGRTVLETVLAVHLVVAAVYWWLSPKGFPVNHSRFWLNSVIPLVIVAIVIFALLEVLRRRPKVPVLCFAGGGAAWVAAIIAGRVLFPLSLSPLWLAGIFPFLCIVVCCYLSARTTFLPVYAWFFAMLIGALVGLFAVWAQVPRVPTTYPSGHAGLQDFNNVRQPVPSALVPINDPYRFHSTLAELSMDCGRVTVHCCPLLTFDRVSPDGFWSILAPPPQRPRNLASYAAGSGGHAFNYSDGSAIAISAPTEAGELRLTADVNVERDTFSHLNSFCVIRIVGHQRMSLSFSPCEESAIEVLPADYPTGRPARFAYLDRHNMFHVVEATSGEKGPFRRLASGELRRGEPLSIRLRDDGDHIASIRLDDWTTQLSTALSPTAGWGVAVNAIEFQCLGSRSQSEVQVWITLAATSVGRGWDCVGHTAGAYRNRLVFDVEPP
jgi:hypothetical protein